MLPDYHLHQHLHPPRHHGLKTHPVPLSITLPDTPVYRRVQDHIQTQRYTGERGPAEAVRLSPTVCLRAGRLPHTCSRSHRSTFTLLPHPAATSHTHMQKKSTITMTCHPPVSLQLDGCGACIKHPYILLISSAWTCIRNTPYFTHTIQSLSPAKAQNDIIDKWHHWRNDIIGKCM